MRYSQRLKLACLSLAVLAAPSWAADRCAELPKHAAPVTVLIVTGGHSYEPSEFFAAFNSMPNVRYDHVLMMGAKPAAGPVGGLRQYDAILFYDREPDAITPEWEDLLARGKGLVFLHHAIGSFKKSPEFKAIAGGHTNFSGNNQPGVPNGSVYFNRKQRFTITDRRHPVTCGMSDFEMTDEAYDDVNVDPAAHVLMTSDAPKRSPAAAWTWSYEQKRVIYIQPGHGSLGLPLDHGPTAYQDKNFKRLLRRGILWAAGRL